MPRLALILALLLGASALAPPASAHAAGSGIVTQNGSFVLLPHAPNTTTNNTFHAYISTLGLPIGPGDVLVWAWSANGAEGPPIYFEIHRHVPNYTVYLEVTADRANDSWNVPGADPYMVYWVNLNAVSENVTYSFQLIPPPLNLWPLYLLLVAPLAMIGALVWYARRKKKRST
jgi:hypothetical protein